jgi:hypothetical protein
MSDSEDDKPLGARAPAGAKESPAGDRPARKSAAKAKPVVDESAEEEEEDDDDDDEDDESESEEKPRKKASAKKPAKKPGACPAAWPGRMAGLRRARAVAPAVRRPARLPLLRLRLGGACGGGNPAARLRACADAPPAASARHSRRQARSRRQGAVLRRQPRRSWLSGRSLRAFHAFGRER